MRSAIILDIDGCLADSEVCHMFKDEIAKGDFEWFDSRIRSFKPFEWAKPYLKSLMASRNFDILFVTARQIKYLEDTVWWFRKNLGVDLEDQNVYMFMRPEGNKEDSVTLKRDIYLTKIKDNWNVLFAIDDRPDIIDLWKTLDVPSMLVVNTRSTIEDEIRQQRNISP